MSKLRRSAVRRYHDRVAPKYDHSYDDSYWLWHDALTWDYLKPFLPREAKAEVIDLGCGTGKWSAKLAKSGYRLTCVDISHRMIDQARQKIESVNATSKMTFVQADLADLSALPADRYALAIALGDPIGCTQSPPRTMKQIRRILRDDGVLVATFDNRLSAIDYYLERANLADLSRFLRDGKTHWLTREQAEQFPIVTFSPREAIRLVESAGFKLLDLMGKTVLPMRYHRELLDSSESRRTLAKIEKKLARDPDAVGRASHLQIACRVAASGSGSRSAK